VFWHSREALRAKNRSGARAGRTKDPLRLEENESGAHISSYFGCDQSIEGGVEVVAVASCAATTMTDSVGKENMETEEAVAMTEKAASANDEGMTTTKQPQHAGTKRSAEDEQNGEEQKPAIADSDAAMEGEDDVATAEDQTSTAAAEKMDPEEAAMDEEKKDEGEHRKVESEGSAANKDPVLAADETNTADDAAEKKEKSEEQEKGEKEDILDDEVAMMDEKDSAAAAAAEEKEEESSSNAAQSAKADDATAPAAVSEESKTKDYEKKDDDEDGKPKADATSIVQRPVKRARSAYFVFTDERRAEVQKQVRACVSSCPIV